MSTDIVIEETEHGRAYQCCSCKTWCPLDSIGAIGCGVYCCPDCTEELTDTEISLWKDFMKEHGAATNEQLACLKRIVWVTL